MTRITHRHITLLHALASVGLGFAAFSFGACGDDGPGSVDTADRCVRKLDRIFAKERCQRDDNCPCGTHCTLGRCEADCLVDLQCGDGRCDSFGKCRTAVDKGNLPQLSPRSVGELGTSPSSLESDEGEPQELRILAKRLTLPRVRLVADSGLLVRCDEAGTFHAECELGPVFPGAGRSVHVVENAPLPPGEVRLVRLYVGEAMHMVTYTGSAAYDAMFARKSIEATALAGTYTGYALPRTAEISTDVEEGFYAWDLDFAPRLAVTASIFMAPGATTGVLVLTEPLGVLVAGGAWLGAVELGEESGTVRFSTVQFLDGPLTANEAIEVLMEGDGRFGWSRGANTSLSLSLKTRLRGVHPAGFAPRTVWAVTLSRQGDLPQGEPTPTVPADALPTLDVARASTPLAWEDSALRTLPDVGAVWSNVPAGVVDTFRLLHGSPPELEACREGPAVHEAAARTFFLEHLNAGEGSRQVTDTQEAHVSDPSLLVAYVAGSVPAFHGLLTVTTTTSLPTQTWPLAADPTTSIGRAIPCEVTMLAATAPSMLKSKKPRVCGESISFSFLEETLDRCAAMQADFGCEPVAVEDPNVAGSFRTMINLSATGEFTPGVSGCDWVYLGPQRLVGRVTRVCRLPKVPARCVDAALCVQPVAGSDHASLPTSNLGPMVGYVSGDSLCADTGRGAALPVDENADLPLSSPDRLNAESMLTACLGNQGTLRTGASPQTTVGSAGTGLSVALDDGARCLDPGRFLFALGLATEEARRRLGDPNEPNGDRVGAQAHRLLQRYAQVVGFQAREVTEQERLGQVIRALGDANLPDPAEVLQNSLVGWNLFLHPRFAAALAALPAAMLAAPDYRTRLGVQPPPVQPHHEQYDSLAIAMLDTLRTQMELAEVLVERAARAGDQSVLAEVGALLRVRLALSPLITDMVSRAVRYTETSGTPAPTWLMRYERAKGAADAAEARLLVAADALRTGRNPLGIEDSDLPLYFHGTPPDPGDRFFAISDYLLGSGPGSLAWAPAQVRVAQDALEAARTAWLAQRARDVDVELEIDARATREAAIAKAAGEELMELCGAHLWPNQLANEVLDNTAALDVDSCFFKGDTACQVNGADYSSLWKKADVERQLCQAGLFTKTSTEDNGSSADWAETGLEVAHPGISDYDWMLLTRVKGKKSGDSEPKLECKERSIVSCDDGTGRRCFKCALTDYKLVYNTLSRGDFRRFFPSIKEKDANWEFNNGSERITATLKLPLDVGTLRVTSQGAAKKAFMEKIQGRCKKVYGGRASPPSLDELSTNPADRPSCYAGSLGELALSMQASIKDAEKARAELGSFTESYDIAMRSCIRLQQGNDFIQRATLAHDAHMSRMRGIKLGFDLVARVAKGAKEVADLGTKAAAGAKDSFGATLASGTAGINAAIVETVADLASLSLQTAMDQSDQDHARVVAEMQMDTELDRCVIEAELHLVGARASTLNFQSAILDLERASVELQNAKDRAARVFVQGKADLSQSRTSPLRRLANDFWLDESMKTFTREMRLARRVSYLAVRAVEYEVQQSLSVRGDVLEAEIPDELDVAIDDLMTITATRQLNGSMPSDLKTVISFRRNLLQLADRSKAPDGEQTPSDVERLRITLAHGDYEIFDDQGVYLGQLIPFHLAPLGTLGLGGSEGAYVFSANDCAERVWSVNASIHGEEGLFEGDDPSFVRIDLLKRNTFYSQWCIPPTGDAEPFQVASVRPSRNLFREPGLGPVPGTGSVAETEGYTRGRLEAYFNVPRDEFERDEYTNGGTSELAGRGLYGDYALFFSAAILSTKDENGIPSTGLRLDLVTDILIRLDYVSVARN